MKLLIFNLRFFNLKVGFTNVEAMGLMAVVVFIMGKLRIMISTNIIVSIMLKHAQIIPAVDLKATEDQAGLMKI